MTVEQGQVAERVAAVRARLSELTDRPIRLVAVTKGFGIEAARAAVEAGVTDIGESYAQELTAKFDPELGARWHFIGGLQRNKVRRIAHAVDLWQSIDRPSLVTEVAKRAPGARVLLQVNVAGDSGQGGCPPADAGALRSAADAAGLVVEGLMAIGAQGDPATVRAGFERLVAMADDLGVRERSIGMSGDFELAVAAGATMVRLGTTLFGPRPAR